jgi:SnoaL-like polyketide cyclase
MSESKMTATLRQHLAAEAEHDATGAAATYVADCYYDNGALGLRFEGRAMVEFQYAASFSIIEDMKATYLWERTIGDVVVQAGRISGTAAPEMFGMQSNGGALDFAFTAVLSFRDGLMVGEHIYYDLAEFCAQAGLDLRAVQESARAMAESMVPAAS